MPVNFRSRTCWWLGGTLTVAALLTTLTVSTVCTASTVLPTVLAASGPSAAIGNRLAGDDLLGLTVPQLQAVWGGAPVSPAPRPYAAEYRLRRFGQEIDYKFRCDPAGRVIAYYVSFSEPVALETVPELVPEAAFITASTTGFTFCKLPMRDYAQDALVYAYRPKPSAVAPNQSFPPTTGAEAAPATPVLAAMLLPEGSGWEAGDINRSLRVRGVEIAVRPVNPAEQAIDNPFRDFAVH